MTNWEKILTSDIIHSLTFILQVVSIVTIYQDSRNQRKANDLTEKWKKSLIIHFVGEAVVKQITSYMGGESKMVHQWWEILAISTKGTNVIVGSYPTEICLYEMSNVPNHSSIGDCSH